MQPNNPGNAAAYTGAGGGVPMNVPPPSMQYQPPPSFVGHHNMMPPQNVAYGYAPPHHYPPQPPQFGYPPPPPQMMPGMPGPGHFNRPPVYPPYGSAGGYHQPPPQYGVAQQPPSSPYGGYQMNPTGPPRPPPPVVNQQAYYRTNQPPVSMATAPAGHGNDKSSSSSRQDDAYRSSRDNSYSKRPSVSRSSKRTKSPSPPRRYDDRGNSRSRDNRSSQRRADSGYSQQQQHRSDRSTNSPQRGRSRSTSRDRSSQSRRRAPYNRHNSPERSRYEPPPRSSRDPPSSRRPSSNLSSSSGQEAAKSAKSDNQRSRKSPSNSEVKFYLEKSESDEEEKEQAGSSEQTAPNEELDDVNRADYVQITQIPIYYAKDPANSAAKVRASAKLVDLCNKFEHDLVERARRERAKQNLPAEATQVPDYRQLVTTNKFNKFAQCTCDKSGGAGSHDHDHGHSHHKVHTTHSKSSTSCSRHSRSRMLKRLNSSGSRSRSRSGSSRSSSSSSSSSSGSASSSSSSFSSAASSDSSSRSSSTGSASSSKAGNKRAQGRRKDEKKTDEDDEFDDIKSMEINRKQKHPERLHPELCFNEPDQTNEGPLCKCKLKNTKFGTRHQIYFGESVIAPCDDLCSNSDRLIHYRMSITPFKNFVTKHPTKIDFDNHEYVFEGYSLFSHEPIDPIPDCVVVIYNNEYRLNIVQEAMIENFTIREIELLKQFIFVELLELYDMKWKGFELDDSCNRFHVMPRFARWLPYNDRGKELLSPSEILKYFLNSRAPVVSASVLAKCHLYSEREWLNYVEGLQGSIVTCPGKRPASIRLDQLDRDQIVRALSGPKWTKEKLESHKNDKYPLIIHFNMFRNNWLPIIKNNMKLKKLYHKYFKLRHLQNNKTKLSEEDKSKRRALEDELQALVKKKASDYQKEIMIELSSANFVRTGVRTDMVQQAVLVPTFVEHLRFHMSLKFLEEKIGYRFKNRLLLQFALTHPSGAFLLHQNLGSNPDHIRNTLFNCKVRNPNYGELTPKKRKLLLRKKGIHMLFSIMSQHQALDTEEQLSCISSNYERLEFLGDKILELLTSRHLFFLFPMFDEGQLSEYRNALVQNQYLAVLARKLDMQYFIIFYHGVDLCSNSALNHALANSFEALLAAIYLDSSDLNAVSAMLAKTLWHDDPDGLCAVWRDLPLHPIQAQMPDGDRHLIATTKILQHVNVFEQMIGVEFKHIRLLAQAFCTRSASFNLITLGDNQRLEFLGDTVLNFITSDYLYRHFPNHHEGHLSLLRSSLVCNSTQALLYDELGMSDFVLTSYINNRKEPNGHLKRKADVFEAFVGALYIDQGLEAVTTFCNVCIFNKLQDIIMYQFWNDPKSRLQQCCLSLRDVDESKPSLPTYKLIEEKGPPNHKQYKVAVYFNRKRIGEGIGKSIHDAEVSAAKNALKTKADMFPVLNKYVASQLKSSNYISLAQLEEESIGGGEPKKKPRTEPPPPTTEVKAKSADHSAVTTTDSGQPMTKGQPKDTDLKQNLLNKKGSLLKKYL